MSTKFYRTSPDDVYEQDIEVPRDTDLPVVITAVEDDDDCDDSNNPPFDFTGSTVVMEIFEHHSDDVPILTIPNGDWTITQNQDGIDAGVNNQIKNTIDWDTLDTDLELLIPYWYRVHITDAAGTPYTAFRGEFKLDDK